MISTDPKLKQFSVWGNICRDLLIMPTSLEVLLCTIPSLLFIVNSFSRTPFATDSSKAPFSIAVPYTLTVTGLIATKDPNLVFSDSKRWDLWGMGSHILSLADAPQ